MDKETQAYIERTLEACTTTALREEHLLRNHPPEYWAPSGSGDAERARQREYTFSLAIWNQAHKDHRDQVVALYDALSAAGILEAALRGENW